MKKEGWFLVELIFRVHNTAGETAGIFDTRMKLIKATSAREAYQTTLVLASKEIDTQNIFANAVLWEFAGIGIFETIDKPREIENAVVKYTMPNTAATLDYMQTLRKRNALLQQEIALSA